MCHAQGYLISTALKGVKCLLSEVSKPNGMKALTLGARKKLVY